jgi:hypothetical protein
MPEINGQSLVLIIQAVDTEIKRLRNLPDEETVPDDEVRLLDFENLAEELEEKYGQARAMAGNLPDYSRLVRR